MGRSLCTLLIALLSTQSTHAAESIDELQEQINILSRQVELLQDRVNAFETNETLDEESDSTDDTFVDLTPRQKRSLDDTDSSNVLSKPWWQNIDISGFGAAGFYETGSAGTRGDGGFEIKEASFFVTAEVWDNTEFFVELQTNRLGKDNDKFSRTGEVYVHIHDIRLTDSLALGLKIGRIDIPFGEEYLWQDSMDNPLITNSAAYPYGWDEGILIYGDYHGLGWIAAITDGTDDRSIEENSDKALNFKVYGSPIEDLDLSLSVMTDGGVSKSAIEFGGSHFRPIGAAHQSTVGTSPSIEVSADLIEVNAKYRFSAFDNDAYLAVSYGAARAGDNDSSFDRDFQWFSFEPVIHIAKKWYAALRYSEIGTYDGAEGYHFDGKTFAGGNSAFGYDVQRFGRLSLGLGWVPNPHIRAKFEIARDRFELIDMSPISANNSDRGFAGFELAVSF